MTSIKFFLANPKVEATSIDLIVLFNGKRLKKGVGVSVVTKYWNPQAQRAVTGTKYPDGSVINFKLDEWKRAVDRLCRNIEQGKVSFADSKHFWELVNCEKDDRAYVKHITQTQYISEYFKNVFLPKFIRTKSESRITSLKVAFAKLADYETSIDRKLRFDEINIEFYRNFRVYMLDMKHSINYFGSIIKILKQVMREAHEIDKLHENKEYLSSSFKSESIEVDTVYLTTDELMEIANLEVDDEFIDKFYPRSVSFGRESLKRSYKIVKNRFLIGAFTGLRMSDFNKLSKENIQNGKITVITQKTNQRVIVPVHPVIRKIIDDGFDFNESLSDQKTRSYIKHICKYIKMNDIVEVRDSNDISVTQRFQKWELVSSHTARRSFATNARKAGIPDHSIMKILGHTTYKNYIKYLRISQEENADMLAEHSFFK